MRIRLPNFCDRFLKWYVMAGLSCLTEVYENQGRQGKVLCVCERNTETKETSNSVESFS